MVKLNTVLEAINARMGRALLFAQAALPEHQFQAYKKLVLDEFGQRGLEKDLERMYAEDRKQDMDRNGRE